MKFFGGTLFGILVGFVASFLFTAYVDRGNEARETNIVNVTASNTIKELENLQNKKDVLHSELETANTEITKVIKLLKVKDDTTSKTIQNIRLLLSNNNYNDTELLIEQRLKEGNYLYFYAQLMKTVKDSQGIYNNLKTVEVEHEHKLKNYNMYKQKYSLLLDKKNKVNLN